MKSIWKPALFFVFCLIITLLINMPVGHLMAQAKIPDTVKILQLQGSLLKGQANTVVVNQLIIHDLEYVFDGSCLITVSLCYQLNFAEGSVLVRFVPISGSIEVSQLDIELSMDNLSGISDQLLIKPSGSFHLSSDKFQFVQGKLADIGAIMIWKNAGIVGEDINLGDYQLNIKKDAGLYQVSLADKEAILDVVGKGDLKSDGRYSLDIDIKASSGLEPRIKSALEFVASKKGLRQYSIRQSGTFNKKLLSYLSFEDP
jgi:hypothetical protein